MIAIGIGANSSATSADIAVAISSAHRAMSNHATLIATLTNAPFAFAAEQAAQNINTRLTTFTSETLATRNADCQTASERTLARFGVASIAEASALVAAGQNSRLILPRIVCGPVTAAAAISADHTESPL
ncbi:MAG: precorrin methylase [Hyphomicrobium sp.]|nr:MAG: precorrin methylase [Hyphomicrobium sp.]PPD01338.1 MAG: precorrin methylase [Hyphomicrobium sp.]